MKKKNNAEENIENADEDRAGAALKGLQHLLCHADVMQEKKVLLLLATGKRAHAKGKRKELNHEDTKYTSGQVLGGVSESQS